MFFCPHEDRVERALDVILSHQCSLAYQLHIIMSAIETFSASVQTYFDRQDTAVTALQGDVKNLTDQIAALQNSNGAITPSDQALLDAIQARAGAISDKLDALDALTPPVAPVATKA